MLLRNGKTVKYKSSKPKVNQKEIMNQCAERLPQELLSRIVKYHHCEKCHGDQNKHCYNCNKCNVNKYHLTCEKCHVCYSKYKTRIFNNIEYYHTLNAHIHCEECDHIKDYSMKHFYYYCSKCE